MVSPSGSRNLRTRSRLPVGATAALLCLVLFCCRAAFTWLAPSKTSGHSGQVLQRRGQAPDAIDGQVLQRRGQAPDAIDGVVFGLIGDEALNAALLDMILQEEASSFGRGNSEMLRLRSNAGGWQSRELVPGEWIPLADLCRRLQGPFKDLLTEMKGELQSSPRMVVKDLWANINRAGHYNVVHAHAPEGDNGQDVPIASGVYFVTSGASGDSKGAPLYFPANNAGNIEDALVDPKPGLVVLFPAWREHGVKANPSSTERVSIAFNLIARWPSSPLHDAAIKGNVAEIGHCLGEGNVNAIDPVHGFNALHFAAEAGQDLACRRLMQNAPELASVQSADGTLPIHLASQRGHFSIVSSLVENGADAQAQDARGVTALHLACERGFKPIAEYLVGLPEGQSLVRQPNAGGETPLHCAALEGHVEIAGYLLDHGADPSALKGCGASPVHWAASSGYAEITDLLIRSDPKLKLVDAPDETGITPLHCAARSGHNRVVATLLSVGADQSARDHQGFTALHIAGTQGHVPLMQTLLSQNDPAGRSPLDGANNLLQQVCYAGHVEVATLLLDARANADESDANGMRPIILAGLKGHTELMHLLIGHGATINMSELEIVEQARSAVAT